MPNYSEIHEYVLGQIRRETDFLNMSIVRMEHSLAILQTILPLPENMRWLCIVDWCRNDIATAETRIELWWQRLECIRKANLLVEILMMD